jgi:hypothetical protein
MTLHVIDEDDLVSAVRTAARRAKTPEKLEASVRRYLARVDREYADNPPIVSTSVAAEMLGKKPPNVVLMRERGELPEAFSFRPRGGSPVFAVDDVERKQAGRRPS